MNKIGVLSCAILVLSLCRLSAADTVKAAWFAQDISCKVGTPLAGYGPNDISVAKLDDLELHGLALDDGVAKTLLISFDLLGMDADLIRRMRHACASILGVEDKNVMLTCTHTHGGPHVRRYSRRSMASNPIRSKSQKTSTPNTSHSSRVSPWMS